MSSLEEHLRRFDGVHEALGLSGLSTVDLAHIERSLGAPLPDALRQWWTRVGLDNGLGGTDHGYLLKRREQVVGATLDVLEATQASGLFAFAEDGAGDVFLVRDDGSTIVFWDHETNELVDQEDTFEDWVRTIVDDAVASSTRKRQRWLQLSMDALDDEALLELFESAGFSPSPPRWEEPRVIPPDGPLSPRGLSRKGELIVGDQRVGLSKAEWTAVDPRYTRPDRMTLHACEPPRAAPEASILRTLSALLERRGVAHDMRDGGIQ